MKKIEFVIADFNKTFTLPLGFTSWSVFVDNGVLGQEYVKERGELYEKYVNYEKDETLPLDLRIEMTHKWWQAHANLLVKYGISDEMFSEVAASKKYFQLRPGVVEFFHKTKSNNIPVVLVSAAMTNLISKILLLNKIDLSNVFIVSNNIIMENGVGVEVDENIVHTLSKGIIKLPNTIESSLEGKSYGLILGDQPNDSQLSNIFNAEYYKIGFATKKEDVENLSKFFDEVVESEGFERVNQLI